AYAGLRRRAEALALADTTLRGISDAVGGGATWVLSAALEFRAHADSVSAARLIDMVRVWYAAHPMAAPTTRRLVSEGQTFYLSGQLDSAESRFAKAMRDTVGLDAAGFFALVRAARGDTARAKAIGDSLGALPRKWLFGAHTYWQGAIAGAVGK